MNGRANERTKERNLIGGLIYFGIISLIFDIIIFQCGAMQTTAF